MQRLGIWVSSQELFLFWNELHGLRDGFEVSCGSWKVQGVVPALSQAIAIYTCSDLRGERMGRGEKEWNHDFDAAILVETVEPCLLCMWISTKPLKCSTKFSISNFCESMEKQTGKHHPVKFDRARLKPCNENLGIVHHCPDRLVQGHVECLIQAGKHIGLSNIETLSLFALVGA